MRTSKMVYDPATNRYQLRSYWTDHSGIETYQIDHEWIPGTHEWTYFCNSIEGAECHYESVNVKF